MEKVLHNILILKYPYYLWLYILFIIIIIHYINNVIIIIYFIIYDML